uniref:DUF4160 domain-containing protein n=1 Tax=Parascaris equorum TaxID=6256 RepID=A0A914R6A0_PAREQ
MLEYKIRLVSVLLYMAEVLFFGKASRMHWHIQVGGHSIILCPDDIHICKPYIEREADFYKKMPSHIAQFTPAFCGEIQVNTLTDLW